MDYEYGEGTWSDIKPQKYSMTLSGDDECIAVMAAYALGIDSYLTALSGKTAVFHAHYVDGREIPIDRIKPEDGTILCIKLHVTLEDESDIQTLLRRLEEIADGMHQTKVWSVIQSARNQQNSAVNAWHYTSDDIMYAARSLHDAIIDSILNKED